MRKQKVSEAQFHIISGGILDGQSHLCPLENASRTKSGLFGCSAEFKQERRVGKTEDSWSLSMVLKVPNYWWSPHRENKSPMYKGKGMWVKSKPNISNVSQNEEAFCHFLWTWLPWNPGLLVYSIKIEVWIICGLVPSKLLETSNYGAY